MSCSIALILRIDKILYYGFDVVTVRVDDVKSFETWIAVSLFLDVVNAYHTLEC